MKSEAQRPPVLNAPPDAACCAAPLPSRAGGRWAARRAWWAFALPALGGAALLLWGQGWLSGGGAERLAREAGRNTFFIAKSFWNIAPYFAVSVAACAWATVSGFADRVRIVFERREVVAVAGAAAVGAGIPICSCGVIPLIAALLAGGVPLAPVMAFWISSPLMSPEKFILTAGMLGVDFAVGRLAAAVLLGAGAGYLVYLLERRGALADQLRGIARPAGACCGGDPAPQACGPAPARAFWREAGSVTLFLGKWLSVAFLLEALIVHYIEPARIHALLGGQNPFAIPLATAVGIPLYTSGVAAIPIAKGLLASGMSAGAAMAFLVAGPVTTVPAMVAVWALVRARTFAIYLGSGIAGSLAAGYLFQALAG